MKKTLFKNQMNHCLEIEIICIRWPQNYYPNKELFSVFSCFSHSWDNSSVTVKNVLLLAGRFLSVFVNFETSAIHPKNNKQVH